MKIMSDPLITESECILVILDSRNADSKNNDSYNSNVQFNFEDPIRLGINSICLKCNVSQFICANSLYNINETNNILSITILNVNTTYTIPYGNYNALTFKTTLLNLLGSDFDLSISTITNKFTLTNSINDFTIKSTSTIGAILGFKNSSEYTSTDKSLDFPYVCNFNGIQSINLYIENFNTKNLDSYNKSKSSIVQSIPIDNTKQQIEFLSNDFSFRVYENSIDYLKIGIKDSLENYINFNNQDWVLTLKFTELKDLDRFHYDTTFHDILNYGYITK